MMLWSDPLQLAALVLVPALVGFLVWTQRRRRRALDAFVAAALLPTVAPEMDPRRRRLRAGLVVAAVAALVLALGGPMWGFRWEEVKREGIDLMIAIDTSRSMLATDVKPNRLARAKLSVRDLVAEARGDRIGLIAFAGTAFLQCPLTLDYGAVLESLDAIDVGLIPRGGTDLPVAIDAGLEAFEGRQGNHQALVLITDGESHEGDVKAAIERAKARGVKIFTVGIGTTEGELIPGEGGGFFKDRKGQAVKSRLDETTLQQIAVDTGGVYLHAAGPTFGLVELYRDHIADLDRRELSSALEKRFENRFQVPLAIAFLLLLIEPLLDERRRPASGRRWFARVRGPVAALLLAVCGIGWLDPDATAREGNRLYETGKFPEAAEKYNQALVDEPESPRLHFNLGDAVYKQNRYDDALASFQKVPQEPTDPARTARTSYNIGNTKFRQGQAVEGAEPQKALGLWAEALVAYRRALGVAPDDVDTKWNHELVERKIAALRKKLEEQQQEHQKDQQQQGEQNQDQQKQEQQEKQNEQKPDEQQQAEKEQPEQQPGEQKPDEQQPQDQQQADGEQPTPEEQKPDEQQQQQADGAEQQDQQPSDEQKSAQAGEAQGADGEPTDEMSEKEAAALLDSQRDQELRPEDMARRLQGARVADPSRDW